MMYKIIKNQNHTTFLYIDRLYYGENLRIDLHVLHLSVLVTRNIHTIWCSE